MGKKLAFWFFLRIPFWAVITSLLLVTLLKWVPVRCTPLMLKRAFQFRKERSCPTEQKWVSLEDFSPELIKAVIACEDNRFFEHQGFDWKELAKMREEHDGNGRKIRGCSTISQQTAKNVFTLGTRTWLRKAAETYWTVLIEWIWGKRRILEVYLNVAETGRGLYGMEAASQHYFGTPARHLDRQRAVALSICLPSPLDSSPDHPTAYTRRRQSHILALIPKVPYPEWIQ